MKTPFEPILFALDPDIAVQAASAGLNAFIVDWEQRGKDTRQQGADTQINHQGPDELGEIRKRVRGHLLCRVNPPGPGLLEELKQALEGGADEILVPMVRHPRELEPLLAWAQGRCQLGILVETLEAVSLAEDLASLPLSRVFVGLNDLSIARGRAPFFEPLLDGTLDRLAQTFEGHRFGFGGLTLPEQGAPLPCRLFLGEMLRLGACFSFLRRAFYRDFPMVGMVDAVAGLLAGLEAGGRRTESQVTRDRLELESHLRPLCGHPA